jgi:steroid 5-alpha reductase family enzyme
MIQRVRIALIAFGVIAFTIAQQTGREWLRWVGVALVAVAFFLRFAKR